MSLSGQRIVVTGGAGFIGSHLVEALVRAGARVAVYDNFSSGFEDNIADVAHDVEVVRGDILDPEALNRVVRGADAIAHQAAQLEIMKCIETPVEDLRSNAEGTLNVLEAARRNDVRRVVWASSACVYGQAQTVPEAETHPRAPNWPYGISKLAAEHYARLYYDYYGFDTVGLRYSIVYGPREWYGRVMTAYLRRALDGGSPVIWGGTQQRDFVYVEDVVRMNVACLAAETSLRNQVFNVSTGRATSIRELAEMVSRTFGLGEPIVEDIAEGEVSNLVAGRMRLPAELQRMVLDPGAAREVVGWRPTTELPAGMMAEMEWLRANADRWSVMHY
ncbi:MAG: NAD-dependent epimerase/dehydratase family protein [Solirubrobacteraceae bacterium]